MDKNTPGGMPRKAPRRPFSLEPTTLARLAQCYYPHLKYDARVRRLRADVAAHPCLEAHLARLGVSLTAGRGRPVRLSLRAVCVLVRHLGWPARTTG